MTTDEKLDRILEILEAQEKRYLDSQQGFRSQLQRQQQALGGIGGLLSGLQDPWKPGQVFDPTEFRTRVPLMHYGEGPPAKVFDVDPEAVDDSAEKVDDEAG